MAFDWSSIASSGLNALGSVLSGIGAKKAAREYNKGQMELAKYQNEYNYKMWQEQNAYNSPAAQMARYQEAGLNPMLIYGQGSPGNASSAPTAAGMDLKQEPTAVQTLGNAVRSVGGIMSEYLGLRKQVQELENLKSENQRIREQSFLLNQQRQESELRSGTMYGPSGYYEQLNLLNASKRDLTGWQGQREKLRYLFDQRHQADYDRKLLLDIKHAKNQTQLDTALLRLRQRQYEKLRYDILESDYQSQITDWRLGQIGSNGYDPYHSQLWERALLGIAGAFGRWTGWYNIGDMLNAK